MKKLLAAILSIAIILVCFAGCGANPKKQEAIDAFNKATTVFDGTAKLINENADVIDDEIITAFQDMSALLTEYKTFLEGDEETTDEAYDAMISWLNSVPEALNAVKADIEAALAGADEAPVEEADSVFPEALSGVDAYEIPDLTYSGWEFAGGVIDGAEMTQDEADAILAACGGAFQLAFLEEGQAMMINGEQVFEGTYEVVLDNAALYIAFPGYEYYAVVTVVEDYYVMIASNVEDPTSAFYFSLIDEH